MSPQEIENSDPTTSSSSSISSDLPKHLALNVEIKQNTEEVSSLVKSLLCRVSPPDGDLANTADKGISLLELKNLLMIDYLSDLAYLCLRKASGKSIDGDASVERLVTTRTVMEKMRPLEQKLKYQIGKAIKTADTGLVDKNDPLMYKANPGNLVSKLDNDDSSEDDGEDDEQDGSAKKTTSNKYVAPKNVPAYFDDGEEASDEEGASNTSQKRQKLSRSLIEDLKRQHLDTPEEVLDREDLVRKKQLQAAKERERFEEDNFMRLPMSKKDKSNMRRSMMGRMSTVASIGNEITDFGRTFSDSKAKKGGKRRSTSSMGKGAARKKFKKK